MCEEPQPFSITEANSYSLQQPMCALMPKICMTDDRTLLSSTTVTLPGKRIIYSRHAMKKAFIYWGKSIIFRWQEKIIMPFSYASALLDMVALVMFF